ncbi:hypothetical protein ABKN59_000883 [Abortiporus biennis]
MAFNNDNDNFSNDPNNFGSTGGGRRSNRNEPLNAPYSESDFGAQGPLSGTQGQQGFSSGRSGGNDQWGSEDTSNISSGYRGDTSESGIPGAGGNEFGSTGRQGQQGQGQGQYRGYEKSQLGRGAGATTGTGIGESGDNDEWDNTSGDKFNQSSQGGYAGKQSAAKPPMGERLKGTMEQMTGKVTGNQGMAERGQERKAGDNSYGGSSY